MASRAEALEARFAYRPPGAVVLEEAVLGVAGGELVVIDAPSGTGSSLVLAVLAGLLRPTSGHVDYGGRPIGASWSGLRALVEQDQVLAPELTAAETVSLPLRRRRLRRGELAGPVSRWLETFGLAGAADQLTTELSGGQRQRVGLARAFATGAPVLLLDDPTAELDADNRSIVVRAVRDHIDAGGLAVVASHDPDVLAASDRLLSIVDRRLQPPA